LTTCAAPGVQPATGPEDAEPAASSQTPLETLKVSLLCCYLSDAAFLIAREEGYFAEQGLELEVIRYSSTAEGLAALVSGEVDILGSGIEPGLFNTIARGESLKIVADKGQSAEDCDSLSTVVRTADLEKWNAGSLEEVGQAKVAISGNNAGSFYVELALQSVGLSLEDLEVVSVPGPNRVEALVSGSADMSGLSEPYVTRALDTGQLSLFKPAGELGTSVQVAAWSFGDSLLNENRELGQRFINAYLKGLRQFNEGKTDRNIAAIARGTELEPELVARLCWSKLAADGQINLEYLDLYQDWLLSKGLLDAKIDPAQYWDGSFAEQAAQNLSGEGQ
jgi:NitT/TauT family transport system substrate-binding protein